MRGRRDKIVAVERGEGTPYCVVDIWRDPPRTDIAGRREPSPTATVNEGEGRMFGRAHGRILDRRHRGVSIQFAYVVYMLPFVHHMEDELSRSSRETDNLAPAFVTLGAVFQQFGLHVAPRTTTCDRRRFLGAATPLARICI